jgi:hypothetical protein
MINNSLLELTASSKDILSILGREFVQNPSFIAGFSDRYGHAGRVCQGSTLMRMSMLLPNSMSPRRKWNKTGLFDVKTDRSRRVQPMSEKTIVALLSFISQNSFITTLSASAFLQRLSPVPSRCGPLGLSWQNLVLAFRLCTVTFLTWSIVPLSVAFLGSPARLLSQLHTALFFALPPSQVLYTLVFVPNFHYFLSPIDKSGYRSDDGLARDRCQFSCVSKGLNTFLGP